MKTKERIIKTASDLYAERGFDNVSVRDITKAANANLSAINYHFVGKDGLVSEVISKTLAQLNDHRIELLKKVKTENEDKLTLRQIISAFVTPSVLPEQYGENPDMIARLAAYMLVHPQKDISPQFVTVMTEFTKEIQNICSELSSHEIYERLRICAGSSAVFRSFAQVESEDSLKAPAEDSDKTRLEMVIDFCTHGFMQKA